MPDVAASPPFYTRVQMLYGYSLGGPVSLQM
jgi:hypothetical protein